MKRVASAVRGSRPAGSCRHISRSGAVQLLLPRRARLSRSDTGPRCRSFSGFATDRTHWTLPSAVSSDHTATTRSPRSTSFAPGWPLTPTRTIRMPDDSNLAKIPASKARHAIGADHGARDRGRLAPAVAVEGGVGREQTDEAVELSSLAGGEELPRDLIPLLGRGLEASLARVDVALRPSEDLPAVLLALLHDLRDLLVRDTRTPPAGGTPRARPARALRGPA